MGKMGKGVGDFTAGRSVWREHQQQQQHHHHPLIEWPVVKRLWRTGAVDCRRKFLTLAVREQVEQAGGAYEDDD